MGELAYSVIVKNKADVVFVWETFLDDKVLPSHASVRGYSERLWRDHLTMAEV